MRIAYIFTTFPKLSERFFLREVVELQRQGLELDLYSMFGGADTSEAGPVTRMRAVDWLWLIVELVYWVIQRPRAILWGLSKLLPWHYGSLVNYGENVLGLAFAIRFARRFRQLGYGYTHATWATGPGMVVVLLHKLIGLDYTMEAHAYDVFRDGGDAFLCEKLSGACAIRSSTEATTAELKHRLEAAEIAKTPCCVRRGLESIPAYRTPAAEPSRPLRVLSVGRLIEKKGYLDQLKIYQHWQQSGVAFQATIAGEGPLRRELLEFIETSGLSTLVRLTGKLPYREVQACYDEADLFLFTGIVSRSGDRDGFPNVIGEAMSHSVPVFATDVSGVTEGVQDGRTGFIIDPGAIPNAASQILEAMQAVESLERVTRAAHDWVRTEFSVQSNVAKLRHTLWGWESE
jgi:glycosyltransferase involved in cell wall biosynthesis